MRPMAEVRESQTASWLERVDEEARVAYGALRDDEIAELVEADPSYYVPRLRSLGLKWPR